MFWKKNLSKSTIFGILEQIIRRRLIHSVILKHLQIMIYQNKRFESVQLLLCYLLPTQFGKRLCQ